MKNRHFLLITNVIDKDKPVMLLKRYVGSKHTGEQAHANQDAPLADIEDFRAKGWEDGNVRG